jgi:hypothetical protein
MSSGQAAGNCDDKPDALEFGRLRTLRAGLWGLRGTRDEHWTAAQSLLADLQPCVFEFRLIDGDSSFHGTRRRHVSVGRRPIAYFAIAGSYEH